MSQHTQRAAEVEAAGMAAGTANTAAAGPAETAGPTATAGMATAVAGTAAAETEAAGATAEAGDLLSAMVELVSTWSSLSVQAQVAHGVGLNINESDVRSLHTIGRLGSVRPAELADWLHLSRPTASKSLSRLDSAGLTERRPAPDDRRATLISLSPAGSAAYERLVEAGLEMVQQALASEPGMHEHADSFIRFATALRQGNGSQATAAD